jgi:hypothetical protein
MMVDGSMDSAVVMVHREPCIGGNATSCDDGVLPTDTRHRPSPDSIGRAPCADSQSLCFAMRGARKRNRQSPQMSACL